MGVEHGVDHELAGHARPGRLARGVHVGDGQQVGVDEGVGEVAPQRLGAAVAVGLEDRHHPRHGPEAPAASAAPPRWAGGRSRRPRSRRRPRPGARSAGPRPRTRPGRPRRRPAGRRGGGRPPARRWRWWRCGRRAPTAPRPRPARRRGAGRTRTPVPPGSGVGHPVVGRRVEPVGHGCRPRRRPARAPSVVGAQHRRPRQRGDEAAERRRAAPPRRPSSRGGRARRWSRRPASAPRARKVPSLSSASTTSGPSPPTPRCGRAAGSSRRPPSPGLGPCRPGSWSAGRTSSSCRGCPATATVVRRAHRAAQGRGAVQHRDPPLVGGDHVGVVVGGGRGHDHRLDVVGERRRRGPVVTSTPSDRQHRQERGVGAGSWPLTRWPLSASSVATALMPAPPTLATCTRRGVRQVEAYLRGAGPARAGRGHGRAPRPARRSRRPRRGRGRGLAARDMAASRRGRPAGRRPRRQAGAVQLGVGHHHGGARLLEVAGVGGLVVGGDERRGHQHRRQAGGQQLEAGARPPSGTPPRRRPPARWACRRRTRSPGSAAAPRRHRRRLGGELLPVARADHVADVEVGAPGPRGRPRRRPG